MKEYPHIRPLPFRPTFGLGSPHIQTILPTLLPAGNPPPSTRIPVELEDGDTLYIYVSTPPFWNGAQKTVVLLHGLGGDYGSDYMVRVARKMYQAGHRVVRVNMRSAGVADAETRKPYHAGISADVLSVLKVLRKGQPLSPTILIGYSLGGNMALKLAGELGAQAAKYVDITIAVCPPIDLANASSVIGEPGNALYNRYYVSSMGRQSGTWTLGRTFDNLYEFDNIVTAPQWGYRDAEDYYKQCSSCFVLSNIQHPCYLVFAADDPFVDYTIALANPLHPCVDIWVSPKGGHLGFIGPTKGKKGIFWIDQWLLDQVENIGHIPTAPPSL